MDGRHFGLAESGNGHVSLLPIDADPPPTPASETNTVPALIALGEMLDCCGVPNALQVAAVIASHFSSMAALLGATDEEITLRCDVEPKLAKLVAALGRLHQATILEEIKQQPAIKNFDALSQFVRARLRGFEIEHVIALLLDRKSRLIREHSIRGGTVNHVQLYPREVVRLALLYNASAVILVHNHPSGDPTPSQADIEMSRMVANALAGVGIAFHEHLIVGANNLAGIRAMGLI